MDILKNIYEICFNHIISNDFKTAYKTFSDNYYKNPDKINFLYGIIISLILQNNIKESINFLDKEYSVSPLKNKIKLVADFIKYNDFFTNMDENTILFNIGLFLKNQELLSDAKTFFDTCLVLQPDNKETLTILAEYALFDMQIDKAINLYIKAAKVEA